MTTRTKRDYGTGALHLDSTRRAYYGRWRNSLGRRLNRKVGPARSREQPDGLNKKEAEKKFARMRADEELNPLPPRNRARIVAAVGDLEPLVEPTVPAPPTPAPAEPESRHTVNDAADSLRRKQAIEGCRKSYKEGCESMQRVHFCKPLDNPIGERPVEEVSVDEIDAFTELLLESGLKPKTVRNIITFLGSCFEHAISKKRWAKENPVRHSTRPKRRRSNDANPDLQFLTLEQLEAVLAAIPDEVVQPERAPTRRGRRGPAPPVPKDVWGPVMRVIILVAAVSGLRQSELLGLRWKHVDFVAQRIRVRNAWVRGEHSDEGKSDLSTRRSTPIEDLAFAVLRVWKRRTAFSAPNDLVFAHPETGKPLDRTKVTRKFQAACVAAGVPVIRFHDLRHTFGTHMAAAGTPLRIIQEMMGHADAKTTQVYSHYAPSPHEVDMVNKAFARSAPAPPSPEVDLRPESAATVIAQPSPVAEPAAEDDRLELERELDEDLVVM